MMATYFNGGSEIQADNLQTLYLMNPSYAAYSDAAQAPSSMLLLNPAASAPNALTPGSLQHAPHHLPSHQQLVGIPLAPSGSTSPGDDPTLHDIPSSAAGLHGLVPRLHYNLWSAIAADPPSSGGHQTQIPTAIAVSGGGDLGSPMGFRRPQPVTLATSNALDHHHQQRQQGLSLSLNNSSPHKNVAGPSAVLSPVDGSPTSASGVTNGVGGGGGGGLILGSKYLKAAQQLLDEVVNVGKAISMADSGAKEKAKAAVVATGEGSSGGGCESSGAGKKGGAADLSTAQRQELQMKKAKLLNMLDEVEQRYRQYHSQMQVVALSFEQAAGAGSARSYTALALQTISKQFRCLKDAITSQIKATAKSLGEDDDGGGGKAEGSRSRLRFVDYQLRQQRALQQLGMMQQNAWRPQRGLPERAVSVLRAWLFEHFLHPYPKDSDKHMLAKQTGLTRSQVSNWFINARVRLWKPMVEEMYLEEMKGHEQNGSDDQANNKLDSTTSSKSAASLDKSPHMNVQNPLAPPAATNVNDISSSTVDLSPALQGFSLIRPSDMDTISMIQSQRSPKRQRSSSDMHINSPSSILSMDMEMKPAAGDPSRDLFTAAAPVPNHGGFGAYPIGDIGSRFNPDHQQLGQRYHQNIQGNAVSLTLGLPHCENQHQHNFIPVGQAVQLGRRLDIGIGETEFCGITTSQPPHSGAGGSAGYQGIDIQNRKRFAAQLLPDFVA